MPEKTVVRATLQELGTSLSQGLTFLGGDIEKTLDVVIAQNADKVVTLEAAKVEIVADPENNVEQRDAVAAVEMIVNDETRQELLGAIAGLPQLRGLFTEAVATMLITGREGDEAYKELEEKYYLLESELNGVETEILEFDEANAPGFDIQMLVKWSPVESPEPKTFTASNNTSTGTRKRRRSTVVWSLDEYTPAQSTIEGPEASYHNIRLIRLDRSNWAVEADEGRVLVEGSPNLAMRALLTMCGLSPQRSANGFWGGTEQETAAA